MIVAAIAIVVMPIRVRKAATNKAAAAMVVVVSVLAVGLYSRLGSPDAATGGNEYQYDNRADVGSVATAGTRKSVASVASMLNGLRDRLKQEPDDADGWLLLARSYEHLGRHQESVPAYNRARELGKTDPKLEASIISANLSNHEAASPDPAVRGRVVLSPDAAGLVRPEDTVFVFAKAGLNHTMPLLAVRKSVADLPLEYALTDDLAMVPGSSLANYDEVVVIAQVSRTGRATDVLDGLKANSAPVSPFAGNYIELQISPDPTTYPEPGDLSRE
jgi:hypothetical protein